jgi:hypothetical protein
MQPSSIHNQVTTQNTMVETQPVVLEVESTQNPLPVDDKLTKPTDNPTTEANPKAKKPKK